MVVMNYSGLYCAWMHKVPEKSIALGNRALLFCQMPGGLG
jgi:hypothetical protein